MNLTICINFKTIIQCVPFRRRLNHSNTYFRI